MNLINKLNKTYKLKPFLSQVKYFHDEFTTPPVKSLKPEEKLQPAVSAKYQIFRDENASVILDVNEERMKMITDHVIEKPTSAYEGINLERGITGVYEIEDLVEVLRKDNAVDIFVCTVPKNLKYVDYLCVVSGNSFRHMAAMTQFVRKVFKIKRNSSDILPKVEGENSKDWMALDLGNIALHVFSPKARKMYDLESLWSVGPEFDKECNKPEESFVEMYERHSIYLSGLTPNDKSSSGSKEKLELG